jgi:endoglucanase
MKTQTSKKVSLIVAIVALLSVFFGNTVFAETDLPNVGNLIRNSTFDNGVGIPWHVAEISPAKADFNIKDGKFNIKINDRGVNRWDIQFSHSDIVIEQDHKYTVKFTVSATKNCKIYPKIGDKSEPYNEYWTYNDRWECINLEANKPQTITQVFIMEKATAKNCEFAFYLGGDCAIDSMPYTVSFDDVYIVDPFYIEPEEPSYPTNGIRVNQEGYFPKLSKLATLLSSSTTPLDWQLKNSEGTTVAQGKTTVKGFDHSSGDDIHTIDFSSYTTEGIGYTLVAGSSTSMPFDIRDNLYTKMKYDAMKYFYLNRSGIAIEMPFADSIELVRPAGHPNDVVEPSPTQSYQAGYALDVTGGWYYGGDYGKYAGVGGIATWTLMNEYERALYYGHVSVAPFADTTLNIPESGNGYPDILDEARYNLQALLKLQVPKGNLLEGMVHNKAYDERWNEYATRPDQDEQMRYLQPPTTVATLNLAAIAAQGSRLWKQYDEAFSTICLSAAETAWDAAVKYPDMYTPPPPYLGGVHSTDYVDAEFYWAACELYVTTGKAKYLDFIKSSRLYLEEPIEIFNDKGYRISGCFDKTNPQGMGTITLALVPNGLPAADIAIAKANIIAAAEKLISIANSQGYGVPIEESTLGNAYEEVVGFPFDSNTLAVNTAIVMAYAHEFSGEKGIRDIKYLNGVSGTMDYIMGRNPNIRSYVTGYGEYPIQNPAHYFWANQVDESFPKAPAGCLSSGPNSRLEDDRVRTTGMIAGITPPEKCFMDDIYSWSTNEISLWTNASLAWVCAYLDEKGTEIIIEDTDIGDINYDGEINSLDLALIKKFLLTQDTALIKDLSLADVNGDEAVNSLDYALIKMYLLNSITAFPVEG